jgi:tRNA pseudouridine55 synthase
VLVVDKPVGPSSMAVCSMVRGCLRRYGAPRKIKVGHGGTLDPLASGVLVVLVGKATRLCDAIMAGEKEYLAHVDLAHVSTTDDREGVLTRVDVEAAPTRESVERALAGFTGVIMQTPPIYSAVHVDGKRAYELARQGRDVPLKPREVSVREIRVVAYEYPRLVLDIACGKGVYVRSLARDLGRALGCGGYLTALRRTRVGVHTLNGAVTLDAVRRGEPLTLREIVESGKTPESNRELRRF